MFDFDLNKLKQEREDSLKNPFKLNKFNTIEELQKQMADSYDVFLLERELNSLRSLYSMICEQVYLYMLLNVPQECISRLIVNMYRCAPIISSVKSIKDADNARTQLMMIYTENISFAPKQSATITDCINYSEVMRRMNLNYVSQLSDPNLQNQIDILTKLTNLTQCFSYYILHIEFCSRGHLASNYYYSSCSQGFNCNS